jgi:hypothetical protein
VRIRLLAVWLLLLVLVVAIVVLERSVGPTPRRDSHGQIVSDARMLLPWPVDQLGAIEVAHAGTLHRFERDAAGTWFYHGADTGLQGTHTHQADPAMAARIESAFAAFGRTRIERRFALDREGTEYGVGMPEMLILVYRPNDLQPLAHYAVGDIAPDALSRYVLVVGRSAVVTIPNYQIDNLLALIEAARSSP